MKNLFEDLRIKKEQSIIQHQKNELLRLQQEKQAWYNNFVDRIYAWSGNYPYENTVNNLWNSHFSISSQELINNPYYGAIQAIKRYGSTIIEPYYYSPILFENTDEAKKLEVQKLNLQKLEEERIKTELLKAQKLEVELLQIKKLELQRLEEERIKTELLKAQKLEEELLQTQKLELLTLKNQNVTESNHPQIQFNNQENEKKINELIVQLEMFMLRLEQQNQALADKDKVILQLQTKNHDLINVNSDLTNRLITSETLVTPLQEKVEI